MSTCDPIQSDETGHIWHPYVLIDVAARHICGEPRAGTGVLESRWVKEPGLNHLDILGCLLSVLGRAAARIGDLGKEQQHPPLVARIIC